MLVFNFNTVSIGECTDAYETEGCIFEINDGKICNVKKEDE